MFTDGLNCRPNFSPTCYGKEAIVPPLPTPEPVACDKFERCVDCPYPHHGAVCWNNDGSCLRTEISEIYQKERKKFGREAP